MQAESTPPAPPGGFGCVCLCYNYGLAQTERTEPTEGERSWRGASGHIVDVFLFLITARLKNEALEILEICNRTLH